MKRSPSRISKSSFLGIDNFPLCNVPLPGVEVHPYFKQRPRVRSIGSRVLFFLYLDQRLVGASVQLELKNVNEVLGFHNAVGSPPAGMHFSFYIRAKQNKNHINNRGKIMFKRIFPFRVTLGVRPKVVISVLWTEIFIVSPPLFFFVFML